MTSKHLTLDEVFAEAAPGQVQKFSMSLFSLLTATNQGMKTRAQRCKARFKSFDKDEMRWVYHVTCTGPKSNPSGYLVEVKIVTEPWLGSKHKPQSFKEVDVQVTCGCPAFMYWGPERNSILEDYNLPPLKGTAEPPRRNLRFRDGSPWTSAKLCKHLVEVAHHLRRQKIPWPKGWFRRLIEKGKKIWPWGRKKKTLTRPSASVA